MASWGKEKQEMEFGKVAWAPLWIAMDARALGLGPAGSEGQGGF